MKNSIVVWTANALPPIGVVLGLAAGMAALAFGISDIASECIGFAVIAASFAASFLIARWFGLIDSGL